MLANLEDTVIQSTDLNKKLTKNLLNEKERPQLLFGEFQWRLLNFSLLEEN